LRARAARAVLLVLAVALGLPVTAADAAPASRTSDPGAAHGSADRPPWRAARPREAGPGRFTRELQRRQELLRRHRGKDPAAVLALTGIVGELWGEIDDARLRSFVDAVARDKGRHPLVRAYAVQLLARVDEQAGDLAAARARLVGEGWLLSWQIVGPFENASRAGEDAVYDPERTPFSADASMFGKLAGEPLVWRPWDYDGLPRSGYVALDDLLRPSEQAIGYATCWVHADADVDAADRTPIGTAHDRLADRLGQRQLVH